jgi:hypothetical protein
MTCLTFNSQHEADFAAEVLAAWGIRVTVTRRQVVSDYGPGEPGTDPRDSVEIDEWWEVADDELSARRLHPTHMVAGGSRPTSPELDEHDMGRSSWWDRDDDDGSRRGR